MGAAWMVNETKKWRIQRMTPCSIFRSVSYFLLYSLSVLIFKHVSIFSAHLHCSYFAVVHKFWLKYWSDSYCPTQSVCVFPTGWAGPRPCWPLWPCPWSSECWSVCLLTLPSSSWCVSVWLLLAQESISLCMSHVSISAFDKCILILLIYIMTDILYKHSDKL